MRILRYLVPLVTVLLLSNLAAPTLAQDSPGGVSLLGVEGVTAAAVQETDQTDQTPTDPAAGQPPAVSSDRLNEELTEVREKIKRLEEQMVSYEPGGYWERYHRRKVEEERRAVAYWEADLKKQTAWYRTAWRYFTNFNLVDGRLYGERLDLRAQMRLEEARRDLASNISAVDHVAESYKWYQDNLAQARARERVLVAALGQ